MHVTGGWRRDEQGLSAIVVALSMVALLVFAAFVIDIGAVHVEHRQDQTAADGAALAGALHLAAGDSVATAMAVARQNLTTTFTDDRWQALWAACSDPERDATRYPILARATPCISFGNGFTRIRVRLPDQVLAASFGPVIGVSTLQTHAAAEAELVPPSGGGVLPFGVLNFLGDATNQICLTLAGGCGGNSSDTLRALDSPLVGNPQYGGTRVCRPSQFGLRIEYNTAMGLDHLVVPVGVGGAGQRTDDCDVPRPNTVYAVSLQGQPGLKNSFVAGLGRGLISGPTAGASYPDGSPARLRRIPKVSGWETRSVAGVTLDNRPLWEFIPAGASGLPPSCDRSRFNPPFNPNPDAPDSGKGRMQKCLTDYINGGYTSPMFTARSAGTPPGLYDIQLSSRVAFVPSLSNCCPDGTTALGPIEGFHMVYLQSMYLDSADATQFNPGEGGTAPLLMPQFDGLSALRITDSMVPASVLASGPNGTLRGALVSLIR